MPPRVWADGRRGSTSSQWTVRTMVRTAVRRWPVAVPTHSHRHGEETAASSQTKISSSPGCLILVRVTMTQAIQRAHLS